MGFAQVQFIFFISRKGAKRTTFLCDFASLRDIFLRQQLQLINSSPLSAGRAVQSLFLMSNAAIPHDDLVAGLHAREVCYLAPTPAGDEPPLSDDALIVGLAQSKDGRLRFALAALLLRHPALADEVARLADHERHPKTRDELRKQYVAAMYLQRLWRTRLRLCLGEESPLIPERFLAEMNLPPADEMFGERGLRELCERSPFNDWSSYEQAVTLLCDQPCVRIAR